MLFDVGAEYNNYAADISRTTAVGGKFNRRQRQICESVQIVQRGAMKLLEPGVVMAEYERAVAELMKTQLIKLKLLKKSSPLKSVRKYFPHGTSHFLGLDVHDVGDYSKPLAAGVVLTVEPGIYVPEESIGVRIEDDVLITENGCQSLSRAS